MLLGTPVGLLAAKPAAIRVGCQKDSSDFESLLAALATLRQLGFEGFETGFGALRSQFAHPDRAYDRLKKTGLRLLGIHVALKTYQPQTALPSLALLQEVADAGRSLDAERLIVSGAPAVHPLVLRAKADALNKVAKYCKSVGVGCAYRDDTGEAADLLPQTESNVHFVLGGTNLADFFTTNWRRIDAIHVGSEDETARLAKAIRASPWRGWLVAEETAGREGIRKAFGV